MTSSLDRRQFLRRAAMGAASLSIAPSVRLRLLSAESYARNIRPQKIIIVGAGMAGLGALESAERVVAEINAVQ
jgi:hypothetical protein